jgi:hypothetical protein
MNTTSMEFVIAQDKTKKSPIVLSEFMGISKHMADALQVNPWNLGVSAFHHVLISTLSGPCTESLQEVAAAINQGLLMTDVERNERHQKLFKVVTTHTSHTWAALLVKMLLGEINSQNQARMTPYIPQENLVGAYKAAKKRLFLLDYDVCELTLLKLCQNLTFGVSGDAGADREGAKHGGSNSRDPRSINETVRGPKEFGLYHLGTGWRLPRETPWSSQASGDLCRARGFHQRARSRGLDELHRETGYGMDWRGLRDI